MRRVTLWCIVSSALLMSILVVLALLEPNQILVGFLEGDDFFRGRPTRYWRETLKQEGSAKHLGEAMIKAFGNQPSAIPVLRACAQDDDQNVRWRAVSLLGRAAAPDSRAALATLRQALKDGDAEVRLQAIISLHRLGTNAMSAAPDLLERTKSDAVYQVRLWAERALWDVNKRFAIKECGWQNFASPRWNFAAVFPSRPTEEQKPVLLAADLTVHSFSASHHATRLIVAITEYPADQLRGTDNDRFDASRDMMLLGLDAKLLEEKAVQMGPINGREFTVEKVVEKDGVKYPNILKSRVFWVQSRQYQVVAAYTNEFAIQPAVDYFMDSFQYHAEPE